MFFNEMLDTIVVTASLSYQPEKKIWSEWVAQFIIFSMKGQKGSSVDKDRLWKSLADALILPYFCQLIDVVIQAGYKCKQEHYLELFMTERYMSVDYLPYNPQSTWVYPFPA